MEEPEGGLETAGEEGRGGAEEELGAREAGLGGETKGAGAEGFGGGTGVLVPLAEGEGAFEPPWGVVGLLGTAGFAGGGMEGFGGTAGF